MSSNKICGGYDLGNIFININSSGPPPVWSRSRTAQKYLVVDLASQAPSQQPQYTAPVTNIAQAPMAQDPSNTREMAELFLHLYYRRFGPNGLPSDSLQSGSECGGWRNFLPQWIGQSTVLDTAIRAMATCFVGTQYQDGNLINQGRETYLNALQMLQSGLSEPNSAHRKDLLATTLVMSSIELFLSNGGGPGQVTHIEGADRLLACAIESQNLTSFELVHVYALNQGLFECIATRRNYPFGASHFRPTVQQLYSSNPAYHNSLFFQWCQHSLPMPNILLAVDNASKTPASSSLGILNDLTLLETSLAPWHETLKATIPGPWTLPAAQTSVNSVPFPLQFVSIEACFLYCLHWTCQLLILDARNTLLAAPELPGQIAEYASLICRSVQFCAQSTSFASTENMFLPLSVVADYYTRQGDLERRRWCVGAFAGIAEEQKIGYAVEKLGLTEQVESMERTRSRASSRGPI